MNENNSENIIQIFSLLIYKAKIGLTEDERNILIKEIYAQESKSKNLTYKKKISAWTGDTQGFEFLYSNTLKSLDLIIIISIFIIKGLGQLLLKITKTSCLININNHIYHLHII